MLHYILYLSETISKLLSGYPRILLKSQSQQWIERQLKKRVPAEYFMVTFILPTEFRLLAWNHQRILYSLIFRCAWKTVQLFARNDKQLHGLAGATVVLHTHSRDLQNYHPHLHLVMPAATTALRKDISYN